MPARSLRKLRAALALGSITILPGKLTAQSWPSQLLYTPTLVQDGFGSGGSSLPGDGLMYCVPTSTTMSLLYLGNAGFTQIAPANASVQEQLNLVRVMAGLFDTTPTGGTTTGKIDGMALYLAARGLGAPTTSTVSHLSNEYYTYKQVNTPSVAEMAEWYTGSYQTGNITVAQLCIGWFNQQGNTSNYTRDSGHGITLLGVTYVNNSTSPTTGNIIINNPEPHSLGALADTAQNVTQYAQMGLPVGNLAGQTGSPIIISGTQFGIRSDTKQAVIQSAAVLTISANALPAANGSFVPAAWKIDGVATMNTNGGTLDAIAPLEDGANPGGIYKTGAGLLKLSSAVAPTTTGAFTVSGGILQTTNPTAAPLGTGNVTVAYGNLALAPSGGGTNLTQTLANHSTGRLIYNGGGVLSLTPQPGQTLTVTFGGATDGTRANLEASDTGTLTIAPAGGLAELGNTVFLMAAGHHDNLPAVANGIVSPAIVGQNSAASFIAGDFLTYHTNGSGNTTTGFGVASYTQASSIPINDSAVNATTVYEVNANQTLNAGSSVSLYALKVGTATTGPATVASGGGSTTLAVGPQAGGKAGIILNGGTVSTSVLQFGAAEGVIYTSTAGGVITSQILGTAGLTSFGPGMLILAGNAAYSGNTTVQSGTLAVEGTLGNGLTPTSVIVNTEATLRISGQVNGPVTVRNGGTLNMTGGTLGASAALLTNITSVVQGYGTINAAAAINGKVGPGATPGNLTFASTVEFSHNGYFTWKLFAKGDNTTANLTGETPWNMLIFTGPGSGLTLGRAGQGNNTSIELDLTAVPNPNSHDTFWNSNHTWTILTSVESPSSFNVRLSSAMYEQGEFKLVPDSGNTVLTLTYTPVPEPGTVLGLSALGWIVTWSGRRKRRSTTS
jgi:autotransporter-associated beta strand protein